MKKMLTVLLSTAMALSLCFAAFADIPEGEAPAGQGQSEAVPDETAEAPDEMSDETVGASDEAADTYAIVIIDGMDNSEAASIQLKKGDTLIIKISCAAPADMGPVAEGEEGSGVTATSGTIAYSDITTGGPNSYPTAETVTITGINADTKVTITPNPDEADSVFPEITIETEAGEAYPMFNEYKEYLIATLLQDDFWSGKEDTLRTDLDACETPYDDTIGNFTGSGDVDQAPSGVTFPMTYDAWYAENGSDETYPKFDEYKEYLIETLLQDDFWSGKEDTLRTDLDACETPYDDTIGNFTGSGDVDQAPSGVTFPMTYDAWIAANK